MIQKTTGQVFTILLILGVLVVIAGLVGFTYFSRNGSDENGGGSTLQPTDRQKLLIPRWFLSELTFGEESISLPDPEQKELTIQFKEDGTINGDASCNSYGGNFTADDGHIAMTEIFSTLMACDQGMDAETYYFRALSEVTQFKVEGGLLELTSADGSVRLVYHMPPK